MDKNKLKWTEVERRLLQFLFIYPTTSFRGRELARHLKVSPTSISNAVKRLVRKELVVSSKDVFLSVKLNRENSNSFELKRLDNLLNIYESRLLGFLSKNSIGSTIVLFGSYSFGEDIETSDIDIFLIGGSKPVNLEEELSKFEINSKIKRKINLEYAKELKNLKETLRESVVNGIVLKGALQL